VIGSERERLLEGREREVGTRSPELVHGVPAAGDPERDRADRLRCVDIERGVADDERLRASVEAIADSLTEDGFVLRYRTGETDDGLSGKEGSFLICSFWLVSALAIVGEEQRARDLMEKLLSVASPLGLYAEELDTSTGRHLGNFPQAFSHLALIEAAARIVVGERLREFA